MAFKTQQPEKIASSRVMCYVSEYFRGGGRGGGEGGGLPIFNRPGLAGALLQTPSSFIN